MTYKRDSRRPGTYVIRASFHILFPRSSAKIPICAARRSPALMRKKGEQHGNIHQTVGTASPCRGLPPGPPTRFGAVNRLLATANPLAHPCDIGIGRATSPLVYATPRSPRFSMARMVSSTGSRTFTSDPAR